MKNNITEKTNVVPVIKYETTGALVAKMNSKPGKEGFISIPKHERRDKLLNFKVNEQMYLFLKTYSAIVGCSMTEIILRGVESISGYDGTNADKVIQAWKKHYEKM